MTKPGRARGVCAIKMDVSDGFLEDLDKQGIKGVRLNMDNIGGMPIGLDEIPTLEARIKDLGWHVEYLFPGKDIVELVYLNHLFQFQLHILSTCNKWN